MEALVALGSNLDAAANVAKALRHLEGLGTLHAKSSVWRTAPHGPVEGGDFLNAVVHLAWHGDLDQLRHALKRLERAMGRSANTSWKARTMDLDVVAVREGQRHHRRAWTVLDTQWVEKPFLWRALAEVAPTLSDGNRSAADLARSLGPDAAVAVAAAR